MHAPPGAGTSRLARRLATLLPATRLAEALETTRIHRVAGRSSPTGALVLGSCLGPPPACMLGGGHLPPPGPGRMLGSGCTAKRRASRETVALHNRSPDLGTALARGELTTGLDLGCLHGEGFILD